MLAGGPVYFINAFVNCAMLRRMGCQLPIEWFHLGELTEIQQVEIAKIGNVIVRDLGEFAPDNTKGRGGWQNKVNAILESTFEEILWLDADCWPLADPTYLFDHPFFQETGCVLFPDPVSWTEEQLEMLQKKYGVRLPVRQVESGQMMFHKSRSLPGLIKAKELNINFADTYRILFGDKDTFLIGALQAGVDHRINPHMFDNTDGTITHRDFDGNLLLVHLTGKKLRPHGRPFVTKKRYPRISEITEIATDLRNRQVVTLY